jgi:cytochrome c biogenesis protein CcmG, thiol:disulfide interchange protein DsbE
MRNYQADRRKRVVLYGVIVVLGIVWILFSKNPALKGDNNIQAPQKGFLAPEIKLITLSGKEISLKDLRGHPVIVNFWASWCPPCRAEMPALQNVYSDYKDKGLIILAVNSTIQDTLPDVQNFQKIYQLGFPILLDKAGDATREYQISSMPTSFFIDKEGVIRELVIGGPMTEALLRIRVEKLMESVP